MNLFNHSFFFLSRELSTFIIITNLYIYILYELSFQTLFQLVKNHHQKVLLKLYLTSHSFIRFKNVGTKLFISFIKTTLSLGTYSNYPINSKRSQTSPVFNRWYIIYENLILRGILFLFLFLCIRPFTSYLIITK
jgi:hypothetical protein